MPVETDQNLDTKDLKKYWRTNLKYLAILLSIWFVVSYVLSILLVDPAIRPFAVGCWQPNVNTVRTIQTSRTLIRSI